MAKKEYLLSAGSRYDRASRWLTIQNDAGGSMEKKVRIIGAALFFVASVMYSFASAGEFLITGAEKDLFAVRNLLKDGNFVVDDISFHPGGLDTGRPGDMDAIVLARASVGWIAKAFPDTIGIGVGAGKSVALKVEIGAWCYQTSWDFGAFSVYWNTTCLGSVNTNRGVEKHLETFTLSVPAGDVKKENILWIISTSTNPVYIDAVKLSGESSFAALPAERTKTLLYAAAPGFEEKRSVKGKGKVLVYDGFQYGVFYYEVALPLKADAAYVRT